MSYQKLVEHYEKCYEKYGDNHKGVDWPNEKDTIKRYKVMLEICKFDDERDTNKKKSILDLGCGLGHLYNYILNEHIDVEYSGLDISKKFINTCKNKFPDREFICADIMSEEINKNWDYIVMNGVFTEKRELNFNEMFQYLSLMLKKTYKLCKKGVAFNVMSKDVEWEREDLFHVPMNVLSSFITKEITRDFIIRNDYGLYEYTVYLLKK